MFLGFLDNFIIFFVFRGMNECEGASMIFVGGGQSFSGVLVLPLTGEFFFSVQPKFKNFHPLGGGGWIFFAR